MKIREPKKKRFQPLTIEFETMVEVGFLISAFEHFVYNHEIIPSLSNKVSEIITELKDKYDL